MTPEGLNFLAEGILRSTLGGPEVFMAVAEWSLEMATPGAEKFEKEVVSYVPIDVAKELRDAIRGRLGHTARMTLEIWASETAETPFDFDKHYEMMARLAGAAEA